jgi:hypothetical protein
MTRDDIIRMARETDCLDDQHYGSVWADKLERFANLVAAAEREACASIEVHLTTPDRDYTNMSPLDAYEAALMDAAMAFRKAIRERSAP